MSDPLAPSWLTPPDALDALDALVWPSETARRADGALEIAGVALPAAAARFGTPLYLLDEADARARAERTVAAMTRAADDVGVRGVVYYAAKAFLSVAVARWMHEAGLRLDVCTEGELRVALAAGVPGAAIGLHGNNKSDAELDQAVAAEVGTIVLDSLGEVDRVAGRARAAGRSQGVRLRVNSGVHASTHEYLATAREDQKFGVALSEVPRVVARIREHPELDFRGLHSHIGSQIFDAAGFAEAARRLLAVQRDLLASGPVPELDLGGGFGIAYTTADDAPSTESVVPELVRQVAAIAAELDIPVPDLAIEPGRSIVGPAGVTVYRVGAIKDVEVTTGSGETGVRRYVSVDGGMSDNLRTALYGATYTAVLANRSGAGPAVLCRVAGKHCESGDIVVRDVYLPADVAAGDLLAVPATGAYHHALASNYNHVGRPPMVAVRDGESRVLVRGETVEDLLRRDTGYAPDPVEAPALAAAR